MITETGETKSSASVKLSYPVTLNEDVVSANRVELESHTAILSSPISCKFFRCLRPIDPQPTTKIEELIFLCGLTLITRLKLNNN